MTTKEQALHAIEELPEEATWEDVLERMRYIAGIRNGLRELDEGKGIPHEQVMKEVAAWLAR